MEVHEIVQGPEHNVFLKKNLEGGRRGQSDVRLSVQKTG